MNKKLNKYEEIDNFIQEIQIESIDELNNFITGKKSSADLRKNYIFRGVPNENFDLIPSALRKNEDSFEICNFNLVNTECRKSYLFNNKSELAKFLYIQENKVLLEFLNRADKSGLKVPFNQRIREMIHKGLDQETIIKFRKWPYHEYFEIMALAQHYGLPTRALDWSYDYKIALYFAVNDILYKNKKQNANCALWALNYNIFEKMYTDMSVNRDKFPLEFYRAEYNLNNNLNAQKGIFTIWIDNIDYVNLNSLEDILYEEIKKIGNSDEGNKNNKLKYLHPIIINQEEKMFYKFIIPEYLKPKILNELYLSNYSEEFLFPGYNGVTLSMKNKRTLSKILND